MKFAIIASLFAGAAAHGAMTHPRPRNAFSSDPSVNASKPGDKSCLGDACYWYQVGCHIGCPACDLKSDASTDLYTDPHCTKSEGLMEPTNNDPKYRTWDPYNQSPCGDWTKYNPWRAPGKAPVADPCGVASGYLHPGSYEITPVGYEAGAKGSEVLPEREPTYWKAGGTAQVGWGMQAQHGGGYSYRLCPKGSTLSEECFQRNTLTFATDNSTIHWDDGSHADKQIVTTTYVAPDGTQWRTNPAPGCACDNGIYCSSKESGFLTGHNSHLVGEGRCKTGVNLSTILYAQHGSPNSNCPEGAMFEADFDGYMNHHDQHAMGNTYSVMDVVNVPNKPGEYVLGWRWDCEGSDQVWNSCADITITDGRLHATTLV